MRTAPIIKYSLDIQTEDMYGNHLAKPIYNFEITLIYDDGLEQTVVIPAISAEKLQETYQGLIHRLEGKRKYV